MKKIWGFLATFFMGVSAGLILMYKLAGEKIVVNVKKVKNKRVGSSEVNVPISIEKRPKRAKKRRNEANS